jgi:hypothetical protein
MAVDDKTVRILPYLPRPTTSSVTIADRVPPSQSITSIRNLKSGAAIGNGVIVRQAQRLNPFCFRASAEPLRGLDLDPGKPSQSLLLGHLVGLLTD